MLVFGQFELADLVAMHFVRPVGNAQQAREGIGHADAVVIAEPGGAEGLDRPVHHLARHVRHRHLDHGDFRLGALVAHSIHHVSGMKREEAVLGNGNARLGDALERHGLLGDRLAESYPIQRAFAHRFQRALREADQAHAMMDAARTETPLRDLESAALAEENVRGRNPHVRRTTLRGWPSGHAVVAEHRTAHDTDSRCRAAPGSSTAACAGPIVGIGLAHDDQDFASLDRPSR